MDGGREDDGVDAYIVFLLLALDTDAYIYTNSDAPTFMTTGDVPQEAKDAMHSPQGKTTNP